MKYAIYIDWDKRFGDIKELKNKVERLIQKSRMDWAIIRENFTIEQVYYRISSTKGTHLKILTDVVDIDEDTLFLILLEFRALWEDDPFRILNDLRRYAKSQDIATTNRIFDIKIKADGIHKTGKWFLLHGNKI